MADLIPSSFVFMFLRLPAEIALSWASALSGPALVHVFYKSFTFLTKVLQIRVKM